MVPDRVTSPYLGLVPYTEDDAQFFFGREREQRMIVANLFASHLTLVYGGSGVGKSSLLRAGVIKELRDRTARRLEEGDEPDLVVVYFNEWQTQLADRLRDALRRAFSGIVAPDVVEHALERPSLSDVVSVLCETYKGDLFIILDQFEEFFLYHGHKSTPDPFFEADLPRLANRTGEPVSLLLALRDDALSKLDHFKTLIPNLFANYLRVHHLAAGDAREAICRPLEAYNALPDDRKAWKGTHTAEPEVVTAVIDEVRTGKVTIGDTGKGHVAASAPQSVETPYLQLVMQELWRRETEMGSLRLRRATLEELGGAATIVRNHLNATMNSLDAREQQVCVTLFQFLVTPTGTKIAHSATDLAGFAKRSQEEIELVLARLSGSGMRILSPVAPPTDRPGPIRYEIYHDSLAQAILEWRRKFVEAQERSELEREATRQREELEQARALADANQARADAESQRAAEQRRSSRLFRVLALALTVVTAAAVLVAVWWFRAERQAQDSAQQARDSAQKARDLAQEVAGMQQLSARNVALQAAAAKSDDEKRRLLALSEELRKQAELLTGSNDQASRDINRNDFLVKQLQAKLDTATARIQVLETEVSTRPSQSVVQERDTARQEMKEAQTQLAEAQGEIERLKGELSTVREKLAQASPGALDPFGVPEAYARAYNSIRLTLDSYSIAFTFHDADLMKLAYPGFDKTELQAMRQFLYYGVKETVDSVIFESRQEATVTCKETRTVRQNANSPMTSQDFTRVFKVRSAGDVWKIISMK